MKFAKASYHVSATDTLGFVLVFIATHHRPLSSPPSLSVMMSPQLTVCYSLALILNFNEALLANGYKWCFSDGFMLRVVPTPPAHSRLLWKVISLQLFAAETCNKFLKIEHHDSIVYRKNERILTFLAGATSQSSNVTVGNTTQELLDLPA